MNELDNFYTDLHLHPTTKPFLINGINDPWESYDQTANEKERVGRTTKLAQCNFERHFKANFRVSAAYLHIPERYVFNRVITSPAMVGRLLNMNIPKLRKILWTQPFTMLKEELAFLQANLKDPNSDKKVVIAQNYSHIQTILKEPNSIAILLCIEGAHNLGFEYQDAKFPVDGKRDKFGRPVEPAETINERLIDERIAFMKTNNVAILTLNHFVFNQLASQPKAIELAGWQRIAHNPISSLDLLGSHRGLTFMGYYLVERCFEKDIIIDVKHCDAVSRRQIYILAEKYNKPVIGSHIAVSGRKTNVANHTLINKEDKVSDRRKAPYFNPWDINLHDDDIVSIHKLGGLMGIILDERVIASENAVHFAKKFNQWNELFYRQLEYIYETLLREGFPAQECFDSVCLGSDFDGLIDPIDSVPTLEDVRHNPQSKTVGLDKGLIDLFRKNEHKFAACGLSPEEIVAKVFRVNFMRFLERHFN